MTADAPARRCVVVAMGRYDDRPALPRALDDAQALALLLRERHGYAAEVLADPTREAVEDSLPPGGLPRADLIVYWIGHGQRGADGALELLGRRAGRALLSAAELGRWAAQTGAQQVLLMFDTCHAGAGLHDSVEQAMAEINRRAQVNGYWFGVLAASRAAGEARSGALVDAVRRLLEHGPHTPDARWTPGQPDLRGDDLLSFLVQEWPHDDQQLQPLRFGVALRPMLRNPRWDIGLGAQPVEHLLQAARGGGEVESWFSGRHAALQAMVGWLRAGQPGLLVLTGPAGCGKSALLGRLASLSLPQERERLLRAAPVDSAHDPGPGSVHAQLALRGLTGDAAAEQLARLLGCDPAQGLFGVLALAHQRLELGAPLVLLLDGLDESGEHAALVAQELVAALAREALVLVAARRLEFGDAHLAALPGVASQVIDLAQDAAGTLADVRQYVLRRLDGVSPRMDAALVAAALSDGRGDDATAPFLLARLVTSQLRDSPLDTTAPHWQAQLVTSAQNALEQDLRRVALHRDGQPLPDAARELMAALAWAHGPGFPADDLWPALATRLSRHGTRYTREDAYALLGELGRHIVASVSDGQPAYRIAHQVLVDYLRAAPDEATPLAVAQAVAAAWTDWMAAGNAAQDHGYLWNFAWLHMADAGADGLALLEQLAAHDRATFLLDLALASETVADRTLQSGLIAASLPWHAQAVACRRELGDARRLTLALFQLSLALGAAGDHAGSDAAAAEATALARALRADAQARELVAGAWFARANAQLRLGRFDAARRWARELLDFLSETAGPPTALACLAHLCMATVAASQNEIGAARAHGREALRVFDATTSADADPDLLREVLACSAFAESLAAQQLLAGALPANAEPPDVEPGRRLLAEHRRTGALHRMADVATSKGLLALARTLALVPPPPDLPTASELLLLTAALAGSEPLRQHADALVLLGGALVVLAQIEAPRDPAAARRHLDEAAQALQAQADSHPLVAFQLGECLNLLTQLVLQASPGGIPQDPAALLARQFHAVAGLRQLQAAPTAALLIDALARQAWLQQLTGDTEGAGAARGEAIDRLRALAPVHPQLRLLLAALLADQTGSVPPDRATEVLALADECVDIVGTLPDPRAVFLAAQAAVNKAAALMRLNRTAQAEPVLLQAEALLAGLDDGPHVTTTRATTQLNLASLYLLQGRAEQALALARQAKTLFATPGLPPSFAGNAGLVELILGQAECASGATAQGTERLQRVVDHVRRLAEHPGPGSETDILQLVGGMDRAAPALWPQLEQALQAQPALARRARWLRQRPPDEWPALARELHDALAEAAPSEQRELRQIVRGIRAPEPNGFDAAWRQANAVLPQWMDHDGDAEWLVVGWWNTPGWPASRDYLLLHPDLLDPRVAGIVEEIGLDPSLRDAAALHLQLLADARAHGVEQAYAPLLLNLEVGQWLGHDDPRGHLAARPRLRRPEVGQWLHDHAVDDRDAAAFLSVWELLQRGEEPLAFALLADPQAGAELLPVAWRASDMPRLRALARLLWTRADPPLRQHAALAWAMAEAVEPAGSGLPDWPAELAGLAAQERQALVLQVTDAIAHHPAAAPALAALIAPLQHG